MTARAASGATFVAAVFAAALTAQGPPRGNLSGFVKGADGKRVVGAAVTLVSRPVPGRLDLGTTDELHVVAGDTGLFRAELLHGRAYTAWATFRDAAGAEQRTEVVGAVFPGPPRELLLAPTQQLRRLHVEGLGAWSALAPCTCTLFGEGDDPLAVPLVLDAEGRTAVPTMPGSYCHVEVRGRDGFVIALPSALYLAQEGLVEAKVAVPAPRELRVRVVDEKQQPIVGATVQHALGHSRRLVQSELGRTDAEGLVRALVAATNPTYGPAAENFWMAVEAAGYQRQVAFCDWKTLADELVFTLPAGVPLRGRLLAKDGAPVRGLTLLPECYAVGNDNITTGAGVPIRSCPVDGDGRFAMHSLHPRYGFRLLATMEPAAAIAAGIAFRPDIAVAPVLWLAVGESPYGASHDLGDLRVDRLVATCIEVTDHAGTPVPGARLEVTTQSLYNSPLSYVTDRVGRLQFLLPEGEFRIGAWVPQGGVATRSLRLPLAAEEPPVMPLRLSLSKTWTVRGVVVDAAGKPVVGATVHQYDRARCEDRALRELTFLGDAKTGPTGPDGAFTLTLPIAEPFAIRAWLAGATPQHAEHVVSPSDLDAQRLRLQLAPWQQK